MKVCLSNSCAVGQLRFCSRVRKLPQWYGMAMSEYCHSEAVSQLAEGSALCVARLGETLVLREANS